MAYEDVTPGNTEQGLDEKVLLGEMGALLKALVGREAQLSQPRAEGAGL